jgi:hypothetical protein
LVVNGKDITDENYVMVDYANRNAQLPLTAILDEMDCEWGWEDANTFFFVLGTDRIILDLTQLHYGWIIPPGTKGGVRKVVGSEIIVDKTSLNVLLTNYGGSATINFDTYTIEITG